MSDIHRLITQHGREKAKHLSPEKSHLIDIAANLLSEDSKDVNYIYSGFCLTGLPHRKLADDQAWERIGAGGALKLIILPGVLGSLDQSPQKVGVPYGPKARLIMLYLQTQAVLSRSPQIELGKSIRDWMGRMGLSSGGQTYREVREQTKRISTCSLQFIWKMDKGRTGFAADRIVKEGVLSFHNDYSDRQMSLFPEAITLSDIFYKSITDNPVPLYEPAIRHLANRSMALDIYIWLAYRLHVLAHITPISWQAIFSQFGAGYDEGNIRSFRQQFKLALDFALAAYPDAKVSVNATGLALSPSHPPVRRIG